MKRRTSYAMLSIFGAVVLAVSLLALAGCSGDGVTGSSAAADEATSNSTLDPTGSNTGSGGQTGDQPGDQAPPPVPGLPRPVGTERIPEGGTFDPVSGWFILEPETDEHGATIDRSYAFFGSDGAAQQAYDEELTAAIGMRMSLEAHPEIDGSTGLVQVEQDLRVDGLAGEETSRVWSGTITEHREGVPPQPPQGSPGQDGPGGPGGPSGPPGDRSGGPVGPGQGGPPGGTGDGPQPPDLPDLSNFVMDEAVTITDVVVPYPLSEGSFPLSGSIARETHLEGGPEGTVDRSSVLTFNGTQYATLVVDGESSQVDLTQPPQPPRGSGPPR
jgi:hypothetical protein